MKNHAGSFHILFFLFLISSFSLSQDTKPFIDSLKKDAINIFIDCQWCDEDYYKQQITFVNYVRERKESHVHILITS